MKILKTLLIIPALMMGACSLEDAPVVAEGEAVEVNFNINMPGNLNSRAEGDAYNVVCAVFHNNEEVKTIREVINLTEGGSATFSPRLIKGRSYVMCFWAQKATTNNVVTLKRSTFDPTNISVVDARGIVTDDAFTAATNPIVVSNDQTPIEVKLTRPFAQLNTGIDADTWEYVTKSLGENPTSTTVTISGCYKTYNAYTQTATGDAYDLVSTSAIDADKTITVGTENYVLTSQNLALINSNANVTISFNNGDLTSLSVPNVPFRNNYKTNIVGDLMTGSVNYTISLSTGILESENNNTIK